MTKPLPPEIEAVQPLKYFATGLGLPLIIAISCGLIGAAWAITHPGTSIVTATKWGVGVGLFISLWSGLEIAFGILIFDGTRFKNRLWMCAGFLSIWIPIIHMDTKRLHFTELRFLVRTSTIGV